MKPRVYLETTIPSYLTARPSRQLVRAAHQQLTRDWWNRRDEYELFTSQLVLDECGAGDQTAATERLNALAGVPLVDQPAAVDVLAAALLRDVRLPPRAAADARHIATSALAGMDYLLTWNLRHLANLSFRPLVELTCRATGCEPPAICTPADLLALLEPSDEH